MCVYKEEGRLEPIYEVLVLPRLQGRGKRQYTHTAEITSSPSGGLASSLERFLQSWMAQQQGHAQEEISDVSKPASRRGQKGKGKDTIKGSSFGGPKGIGKGSSKGTKRPSAELSTAAGKKPRVVLTSAAKQHPFSHKDPDSSELNLARQLINLLKTCLNHGNTDDEVAATIMQHLTKVKQPATHKPVQETRTNGKGKGVKTPLEVRHSHVTGFRNSDWSCIPHITQLKAFWKIIFETELFLPSKWSKFPTLRTVIL